MIRTKRLLGFSLVKSEARRRFVIGYWTLIAVLLTILSQLPLPFDSNSRSNLELVLTLIIMLILPAFLGGLTLGGAVKPFQDVKLKSEVLAQVATRPGFAGHDDRLQVFRDLDERQSKVRDRAHYDAYTVIAWCMLLILLVFGTLAAFRVVWWTRFAEMAFALLAMTLWSLPQSLILWREPDSDEVAPC